MEHMQKQEEMEVHQTRSHERVTILALSEQGEAFHKVQT